MAPSVLAACHSPPAPSADLKRAALTSSHRRRLSICLQLRGRGLGAAAAAFSAGPRIPNDSVRSCLTFDPHGLILQQHLLSRQ